MKWATRGAVVSPWPVKTSVERWPID